MDLNIQLYRITISLIPNTQFILQPVEYYLIETQARRVLIYEITYSDNTNNNTILF